MDKTAETAPETLYENVSPPLPLGLPFAPIAVGEGWHDWPALPDLFPVSFPGVKTSRDSFLVDVDLNRLKARVSDYFDADLSDEETARRYPTVMNNRARFNARAVRDALLRRGGPAGTGFSRYSYRPFDTRWLYWEPDTKLLDEKRADYQPHVIEGNPWLVLQNKARPELSPPLVISNIGDLNQMNSGIYCVPTYLRDDGLGIDMTGAQRHPNLSPAAQRYLERLNATVEDLFHHVLAVLHDPAYREANAGALRMEWPRIPLPGWPDGSSDGAADEIAASAARGRKLAAILDPDTPVPGVTEGKLRPEIAAVAVPSTTGGGNMAGDDFALTAGWGHFGQGEAVMPGQGRVVECPRTASEQAALGEAAPTLGETTFDIYLNDRRLLAKRPRRRLALQARRLPGPQEVALLPRTPHPPPPPPPRRSPPLHEHRPPACGDPQTGESDLNWLNWVRGILPSREFFGSGRFWVPATLTMIIVGGVLCLLCWDRLNLIIEIRTEELETGVNTVRTETVESNSTTIRNVGLVLGGVVAVMLAMWRSLVAQRQADATLRQASAAASPS